MAAGRRFRCPPGPEFWSVDTRPLTEVLAFLKPPCISFGPPFDSNDRGLPAERMSLSVSVVPVSSCSSAARSILFGPRPVVRWPFARRGDCGLPLDILSTPRAGRRRTDGTGVRTQRNECKSRVHRGRRSPPPPPGTPALGRPCVGRPTQGLRQGTRPPPLSCWQGARAACTAWLVSSCIAARAHVSSNTGGYVPLGPPACSPLGNSRAPARARPRAGRCWRAPPRTAAGTVLPPPGVLPPVRAPPLLSRAAGSLRRAPHVG
jgi:hypothetical protein